MCSLTPVGGAEGQDGQGEGQGGEGQGQQGAVTSGHFLQHFNLKEDAQKVQQELMDHAGLRAKKWESSHDTMMASPVVGGW